MKTKRINTSMAQFLPVILLQLFHLLLHLLDRPLFRPSFGRLLPLVIFGCFVFTSQNLLGDQKLILDSRIDLVDARMDFDNTGRPDYQGFEVSDLRLDYKGKYKEKYSYRFRYNYRKSSSNDRFDKVAPGVEYAYLQTNLMQNLTLQVGKVAVLFGGLEYDYLSTDIYRYSLVGDGFPVFEVGTTLSFNLPNQSFKFQLVNSDKAISATNDRAQENLAYAVLWSASFFSQSLVPIFGFAVFPQSDGLSQTEHISLGAQIKLGDLKADLDYLSTDQKSTLTLNTSIVAKLAYSFGAFRPSLKVFQDRSEVDVVSQLNDFSALGIDAALEYYPDDKENIRYHLVYSSYKKTHDADTVRDSLEYKIFLGTKFNLSIL